MNGKIHDVFDVILKIIIIVYGTVFLNYIGIEEEIEEILNVEFTTLSGKKVYLDFLCLLKNGTICHIEFQYPYAKPKDYNRFFRYNIIAEVGHDKTVNTGIFNFTSNKGEIKPHMIGETKSFCPHLFYLGDVDFERYMKKINIKVKSNTKLTNFEEITLLMISLNPEFNSKFEALKRISEIMEHEELFDESKFQFFKGIIEIEINNFLSEKEQDMIYGVEKMTPEVVEVITKVVGEVNDKVLAEAKDDAFEEGKSAGFSEGKSAGFSDGESCAVERVAKSLRGSVDLDDLSRATGLTVDEIKKL